MLPSDGIFRRTSNSIQYFLTRQGRCVFSHLNWIIDPAPPPSRDHGDLTSPAPSRDHGIPPAARKIRRPRASPVSFRESYGRIGERRSSLDQQPITILLPGRLEGRHSVSQHPIIILHLRRLARRRSLGQRPIIIRLPGRLEISLK